MNEQELQKYNFIYDYMALRSGPALIEVEAKIGELKAVDLSELKASEITPEVFQQYVEYQTTSELLRGIKDIISTRQWASLVNIPEGLPECLALKADYDLLVAKLS